MNSEPYQQFLQIQEKIFQVIRIKKKLEDKREFYIQQLRTSPISPDLKKTVSALHSLVIIYEREEEILAICMKGLENARKILLSVESEIKIGDAFKNFGYGIIKKSPLSARDMVRMTAQQE